MFTKGMFIHIVVGTFTDESLTKQTHDFGVIIAMDNYIDPLQVERFPPYLAHTTNTSAIGELVIQFLAPVRM